MQDLTNEEIVKALEAGQSFDNDYLAAVIDDLLIRIEELQNHDHTICQSAAR